MSAPGKAERWRQAETEGKAKRGYPPEVEDLVRRMMRPREE